MEREESAEAAGSQGSTRSKVVGLGVSVQPADERTGIVTSSTSAGFAARSSSANISVPMPLSAPATTGGKANGPVVDCLTDDDLEVTSTNTPVPALADRPALDAVAPDTIAPAKPVTEMAGSATGRGKSRSH